MAVYAPPPIPRYTPEEYLDRERRADFRSEYLNGEVYPRASSSPEHSTITVNVTAAIGLQMKGGPCLAFSNDMKVRTSPDGLFAYPDLSVVCGEPRYHDEHRDVLINPTVIVEVLSPSTEAYDRGRKFGQYQRLESLTDYVLIAQDEPRIDHYVRQSDHQWLLTTATTLKDVIHIESIGCHLALAEVYDRIPFPRSEYVE